MRASVPLSCNDVHRLSMLIMRKLRDIKKASQRKQVSLHVERLKADYDYWSDMLERLAPYETPQGKGGRE